eukprot:Nk52_evm20s32 gene=Nk52_evmTU20s32
MLSRFAKSLLAQRALQTAAAGAGGSGGALGGGIAAAAGRAAASSGGGGAGGAGGGEFSVPVTGNGGGYSDQVISHPMLTKIQKVYAQQHQQHCEDVLRNVSSSPSTSSSSSPCVSPSGPVTSHSLMDADKDVLFAAAGDFNNGLVASSRRRKDTDDHNSTTSTMTSSSTNAMSLSSRAAGASRLTMDVDFLSGAASRSGNLRQFEGFEGQARGRANQIEMAGMVLPDSDRVYNDDASANISDDGDMMVHMGGFDHHHNNHNQQLQLMCQVLGGLQDGRDCDKGRRYNSGERPRRTHIKKRKVSRRQQRASSSSSSGAFQMELSRIHSNGRPLDTCYHNHVPEEESGCASHIDYVYLCKMLLTMLDDRNLNPINNGSIYEGGDHEDSGLQNGTCDAETVWGSGGERDSAPGKLGYVEEAAMEVIQRQLLDRIFRGGFTGAEHKLHLQQLCVYHLEGMLIETLNWNQQYGGDHRAHALMGKLLERGRDGLNCSKSTLRAGPLPIMRTIENGSVTSSSVCGSLRGDEIEYFAKMFYYFHLADVAACTIATMDRCNTDEVVTFPCYSGSSCVEHREGDGQKRQMWWKLLAERGATFLEEIHKRYPTMDTDWIRAWNEKSREASFRRVFSFLESVCNNMQPTLPAESTVSQSVRVSARMAVIEQLSGQVDGCEDRSGESKSVLSKLKTACFIGMFCGDHSREIDISEETYVLACMYASQNESSELEKAVELLILSQVFRSDFDATDATELYRACENHPALYQLYQAHLVSEPTIITGRCQFLEKFFVNNVMRRLADMSTARDMIRHDIDFDNGTFLLRTGIVGEDMSAASYEKEIDLKCDLAVERMREGIRRDKMILERLAAVRNTICHDFSKPGIEEYVVFAQNAMENI